jgi:hypothetical protein
MTHARPRPPRRPRGWDWPLAAALVLVLVAGLVPGAGAEESGTTAESGLTEPGLLAATEQATELAEAYDTQASAEAGTSGSPVAAAGAGTAGGEAGVDGGDRTGEQDAAATGGWGTDDEQASGRQGEPGTVGQDPAGGGPGGCTSGCWTPGASPAMAAAPSGPPPAGGPDDPPDGEQPDGEQPDGEQPAGYEVGAWVHLMRDFVLENPDYLSELEPSELRFELRRLNEFPVPAGSQLAADVADLQHAFTAELERRELGSLEQQPAAGDFRSIMDALPDELGGWLEHVRAHPDFLGTLATPRLQELANLLDDFINIPLWGRARSDAETLRELVLSALHEQSPPLPPPDALGALGNPVVSSQEPDQPGEAVRAAAGQLRNDPGFLGTVESSRLRNALSRLDTFADTQLPDTTPDADVQALRAAVLAALHRRQLDSVEQQLTAGLGPNPLATLANQRDVLAEVRQRVDPNSEQDHRLGYLQRWVGIELAAQVLLAAPPPAALAGQLSALRADIQGQLPSGGGDRFPSGGSLPSAGQVPAVVGALLDYTAAVIGDQDSWQWMGGVFIAQQHALRELLQQVPFDSAEAARAGAIQRRLDAIISVNNSPDRPTSGGQEELLAVLGRELDNAEQSLRTAAQRRPFPGELERILAAAQAVRRDAPRGSRAAEQAAALEAQVQTVISGGQHRSISLQGDPAVRPVPPSKATPRSEVQAGAAFGSGPGEGQQATGTPGLMALTEREKKLATETPGRTATPWQEVGVGRLAALTTTLAAGAAGVGAISLVLLLQALMTAACKGPCPAGMLGPVAPGSPVVPGHLQG